MKRLIALPFLIAAFVMLVAACGAPAPTATPSGPGSTPRPTSTPVPTPTAGPAPIASVPDWVAKLVAKLQSEDVANPPLSVSEYRYQGQKVYYVPARCCDIFSDLYGVDGTLIAHPDGGITGRGDGRAPDFATEAQLVRVIWVDDRGPNGRQIVDAPIEEVSVMPETPADGPFASGGHVLQVRSGLQNACHSFAGWEFDHQRFLKEQTVAVTVQNTSPAEGVDIACAELYRVVDSLIPIPFQLVAGTAYTVDVNGTKLTYTPESGVSEEDRKQLGDAKARWTQAGLTDYTMRFQWSCFCITSMVGPVIVSVADGKVVSVVRDGTHPEADPDPEFFMSVDGLFEMLQEAMDGSAAEVRVTYDPTLGYPTSGYIDQIKMAIDDERSFSLEVNVP